MGRYTKADYDTVMELTGGSWSDYRIASRTGVSVGTVRRWRLAGTPPSTVRRSEEERTWSVVDANAYCYLLGTHPAVLRAFPQHGPGRKHLRPIVLSDWQLKLTDAHPGALIRGLIHSDGCRVVNRFKTKLPSGRIAEYSYIRYFFSNLSKDIRDIFADHCGLLGIRVTQSNHRNLTVSHRDSVAVLEEIVGPKT